MRAIDYIRVNGKACGHVRSPKELSPIGLGNVFFHGWQSPCVGEKLNKRAL